MLFLLSFDDYAREPKEAPTLHKNRLRYAIGHRPRQTGILFKERNLLLFAIKFGSANVYDLNSTSQTRLPSHF
jgi:hypothetical protein